MHCVCSKWKTIHIVEQRIKRDHNGSAAGSNRNSSGGGESIKNRKVFHSCSAFTEVASTTRRGALRAHASVRFSGLQLCGCCRCWALVAWTLNGAIFTRETIMSRQL